MGMTDPVKTMEKPEFMIIGEKRIDFPGTREHKETTEAFGLESLSPG